MNEMIVAKEENKVPDQRLSQVEKVISKTAEEANEDSLLPMSIVCFKLMAMGRE